jgi:hypothetical protein
VSRAVRSAPCVVSVAEHTGWAHLVCVAAHGRVPAVIDRRRVTLIDPGLPTQPYEHDTMAMREDEADDLIARVQKSVSACSVRALERLVGELAPVSPVAALAIREPPFPSIPSSVAAVHASYQLRCSADGMMYQQAICRAARRLKLSVQLCKRGEEVRPRGRAARPDAECRGGLHCPFGPPLRSAVDRRASACIRGRYRRAGAAYARPPIAEQRLRFGFVGPVRSDRLARHGSCISQEHGHR